mmetsp:Transcript_49681/g.118340  ORF Transcript_49681/g.118340 Transcript_49681/m.118340 type:complete len:450 (-) Transcript_49681:111-1460(-)
MAARAFLSRISAWAKCWQKLATGVLSRNRCSLERDGRLQSHQHADSEASQQRAKFQVSATSSRASTTAHLPSLSSWPPEILHAIFDFYRRGDLHTLMSVVATSTAMYRQCVLLMQRVVACRRCHAPLYHPRDVCFSARKTSAGDFFSDGAAVALQFPKWPPEGLLTPMMESAIDSHHRPILGEGTSAFQLRRAAADIGAGGMPRQCRLLVAALAGGDPESQGWQSSGTMRGPFNPYADKAESCTSATDASEPVICRIHCDRCSLYLGEHYAPSQREQEKGLAILCSSYTFTLDAHGDSCEELLRLSCSGARRKRGKGICQQVLCYQSDVLSRRHWWEPVGGESQDSWYINGFVEGSTITGPARLERLAQGRMQVADVCCSACLGCVGWKFVEDCTGLEVNRHQVGRYGLCTSSILELQDESVEDLVAHEDRNSTLAELERMLWEFEPDG